MVILWPFNKTTTMGKRGVSANVPPKKAKTKVLSTQQPRTVNPRAGVPVQNTILEQQNLRVGTDQLTLGTSVIGPVRTWDLPVSGDIVNIILDLNLAYSSGSTVSGSIQPSTAINYILINKADGTPVAQIFGVVLHELYKRFSIHYQDFVENANTVSASQTNTALPTQSVMLPYVQLPASAGPYQISFIYNAYSSLGSYATNNGPTITPASGLTGAILSNSITAYYGDADGLECHIVPSSSQVNPGVNDLAQVMAVKNVSIVDFLMYGFAADTDLDHETLIVNGMAPAPYVTESQLVALYESHIQASRAKGVFWQFPSSQIAFNANSSFQLFLSSTATTKNIQFTYYRLAPP